MLLLIHICLALTSLVLATLACIKPRRDLLALSGSLAALTLASGTYLAVARHAHLLSACFSGLIYLSVVSLELFLARRRLVKVLTDM